MVYVLLFILGIVMGAFVTYFINRRNVSGALVIDLRNPNNDQPFLLELQENVNSVYQKKRITLIVVKK
ncbi:MAG: hypothetical protein PHS74_00570 [Lachnospiraceae bacterium]|nr:hypothetical protein [Lachnospiraceae bacterium]